MSGWHPAKIQVRRQFMCPACNDHAFDYEHLADTPKRLFGPWYCDKCGQGVEGRINSDLSLEVRLTDESLKTRMVLLEHGDLYLVLRADLPSDFDEDNIEYLYNSHKCALAVLQDVVAIICMPEKNEDQHGLFEYVAYTDDAFDALDVTGEQILAKFGVK